MFSSLSADIALYTLSFLSLPDVVKLYTLSRNVRQFMVDNEAAIYHQLAILHRFVIPGVALKDAIESERAVGGLLDGVTTWRELCRRWGTLQRRWSGYGTVLEGGYTPCNTDVHSFRVDERERTVLSIVETTPKRTFTVRAVEDGRLLWSLPTVNQLEISGSFLLLWRNNGGIEIWQRAKDVVKASSPLASPLRDPSPLAATSAQLKQSPFAVDSKDRPQDLRGIYLPHGFLPSFTGQAFRLSHFKAPLLAVVDGEAPHVIQLYDVEEGTLLRRFDLDAIVRDNTQGIRPEEYVLFDLDLSEDYLCACLDGAVVVVPLQATDLTGLASSRDATSKVTALVYSEVQHPLLARQRAHRLVKSTMSFMTGSDGGVISSTRGLSIVRVQGIDALEPHSVEPPKGEPDEAESRALTRVANHRASGFISARLSPDGQHIIVGTIYSTLHFLPDFARILDGTVLIKDVAQKLNIGEPVRDLCWDVHKFMVAVRTEPGDTFIMDLNPRYYSDPHGSSVSLTSAKIFRLRDFSSIYGHMPGNMQMRRTGLWFVWDVAQLHQDVRKRAEDREQTLTYGERSDGSKILPADLDERAVSVCFVDFGDPVLGNPL